ncbi:MAG TPA: hypothetical protein VJ767_03535 [Nitrososphaeraceae archaeon]|nr:hypothetical protein [Nitrososphaeraceae archaeon]
MKQICLQMLDNNKKIDFVGIIGKNGKLITGRSNNMVKDLTFDYKISQELPPVLEIFELMKNCDFEKVWHEGELAYSTIESCKLILVILPLTKNGQEFICFLLTNGQNKDNVEPMIEEVLFGL